MNSREWLIAHEVDSSPAMCTALDLAWKAQRTASAVKIQEAIDAKEIWENDLTLAINACIDARVEKSE